MIKTSDTINTQATGSTTTAGGNQNYIMSLDFHEPAIAIGSYCRVEQPPRQGSQQRGGKSVKKRRKIVVE